MSNLMNLFSLPTTFCYQAKEMVDRLCEWNKYATILTVGESCTQASYSSEFTGRKQILTTDEKIDELTKDLWIIPSSILSLSALTQVAGEVCQRFSILPQIVVDQESLLMGEETYSYLFNLGAWGAAAGIIYTAYKATQMTNRYFSNEKELKNILSEMPNNQLIRYAHTPKEVGEESILAVRIASRIVLFTLNPQNYFNLITLVSEASSLMSIAKRQWIEFQVEIPVNRGDIKYIALNIFLRVYPSSDSDNLIKNCLICPDEGRSEKKEVLLCKKHKLHLMCFAKKMQNSLQDIGNGLQNFEPDYFDTLLPDMFGRAIIYRASLEIDRLPSCARCTSKPNYLINGEVVANNGEHYKLEIELRD